MRRVALIYNPVSGRRCERRLDDVQRAAATLRRAGLETVMAPTRASGGAGEQAQQAAADGCDTVLACGGDGTVHDVLQGVVATPMALGVIPLGTGNALANDLAMLRDPAAAAGQLLRAEPRRVGVGKIEYQQPAGSPPAFRYFTVMAGVGADAQLLYHMTAEWKRSLGMVAYYATAARLFLFHPLVPFEIELSGQRRKIFQVMAVRVRQFGNVLRWLAPDAALERPDMTFALFLTRSRITYALYLLRGFLQRRWRIPGVEVVHGSEAMCLPLSPSGDRHLYAEADGELLGGLPVRISVVPDALTLLIPRK